MAMKEVQTVNYTAAPQLRRSENREATAARFPCQILIVEDRIGEDIANAFLNISQRKNLVETYFADYGLPEIDNIGDGRIRIATNLDDATSEIDAAAEDKMLDLVILDLFLPTSPISSDEEDKNVQKLNGYKLLKMLRDENEPRRQRLGYRVPVVILSSNVETEGDHSYGFDVFKEMLMQQQYIQLPDEILLKEGDGECPPYRDAEELLLKSAKYLIDLTDKDEPLLRDAGIIFDKPSVTRRVLRELKRIALSTKLGEPLPDVLLLGGNGVGKSTFARAYDLLRRRPMGKRIAFSSQDLGGLDLAGSAASLRLFGGTDFADGSGDPAGAWTLGAFSRSTCYAWKKGNNEGTAALAPLSGQIFEERVSKNELHVTAGTVDLNENYPDDEEKFRIDYETSGTLFLDEVVNVSPMMQAMLLQALGYDRKRRHVFTTGRVSRKVPIGPAIVMATRKGIDKMARESGEDDFALRDYLFRIDQIRVIIPPLEKRKDEIIPYLRAAIAKRRGIQPNNLVIAIDSRVEYVLKNQLRFHNNFADLERIADQVRPEETTITFSHVRALYEREVLAKVREEIRSNYSTIDGCRTHWLRIDRGEQIPVAWDDLEDSFDLSPTELLTMCCSLFLHLPRMINSVEKKAIHWPNVDAIGKYFTKDKNSRSFETFVTRRIENIQKKSKVIFSSDPLKAIYEWIEQTGYFREHADDKRIEHSTSSKKKSPRARKVEGRVPEI